MGVITKAAEEAGVVLKTGLDTAVEKLFKDPSVQAVKRDTVKAKVLGAMSNDEKTFGKPNLNILEGSGQDRLTREAIEKQITFQGQRDTVVASSNKYRNVSLDRSNPTYKEYIHTYTPGARPTEKLSEQKVAELRDLSDHSVAFVMSPIEDKELEGKVIKHVTTALPGVDPELFAQEVKQRRMPDLVNLAKVPEESRGAAQKVVAEFAISKANRGIVANPLSPEATQLLQEHFPDIDPYALRYMTPESLLKVMAEPTTAPHYRSPHNFEVKNKPIDNFLGSTRTIDTVVDNTPTRVGMEFQNDLHQSARLLAKEFEPHVPKYIAFSPQQINNLRGAVETFRRQLIEASTPKEVDNISALWNKFRVKHNIVEQDINEVAKIMTTPPNKFSKRPPSAPYEDNWLPKQLQTDIANAIGDGMEAFAVPIHGDTAQLQRGINVEGWYNTTVKNTMESFARNNNMDYKEVFTGEHLLDKAIHEETIGATHQSKFVDKFNELKKLQDSTGAYDRDARMRVEDLQMELSNAGVPDPYNTTEAFMRQSDDEFKALLAGAGTSNLHPVHQAVAKLSILATNSNGKSLSVATQKAISNELANLEEQGVHLPDIGATDLATMSKSQIYAVVNKSLSASGSKLSLSQTTPLSAAEVKASEAAVRKAYEGTLKYPRELTDAHDNNDAKLNMLAAKHFAPLIAALEQRAGAKMPRSFNYGSIVGKPLSTVKSAVERAMNQAGIEAALPDVPGVTYAIIKPRYSSSLADAQGADKVERISKTVQALKAGMPHGQPNTVAEMDGILEAIDIAKKAGEDSPTYTNAINMAMQRLLPPGLRKLEKPMNINLWANPVAGASLVYLGVQAGQSEEEIDKQLTEAGYDDTAKAQVKKDAKFMAGAKSKGYTDEEIADYINGKDSQITSSKHISGGAEPTPDMPAHHYLEAVRNFVWDTNQAKTAQELLGSIRTINPVMTSMWTDTKALFGQDAAREELAAALQAQATKTIEIAGQRGLNLLWFPSGDPKAIEGGYQTETFYIQNEDGSVIDAEDAPSGMWKLKNSPMYQALYTGRGEALLGTAGLAAGGLAAAALLPVEAPALVVGGTILVGSLALGATLGAVGTEVDYFRESMALNEEMHGKIALHKAGAAAEWAVVGEVMGRTTIKAVQGFLRLKDMIAHGNNKGAVEMTRTMMNTTKEEGQALVAQMKRIMDANSVDKESVMRLLLRKTLGGNTKATQEEILATAISQPGGEAIIAGVSQVDPVASRVIALSIDKRAQDLLTTSASITDKNIAKIVREDLVNYSDDVKANYQNVKDLAMNNPHANDYAFDYNKLAIDPVLTKIGNNIEDKDLKFKFLTQANKWREQSTGRSFGDLLELYKLVNEYTFSRRISHGKNKQELLAVLDGIRKEIEVGADTTQADPQAWLQMWKDANHNYSKMKQLETNVLYRAINAKGVQSSTIVSAATKYINALDGTYMDVVAKLPKQSRTNMEGAIIDHYVNKHTIGSHGSMQAVSFPALHDALQGITFTSPEARKLKAAIGVFADFFKNDVNLAHVSGKINMPQQQTMLTNDPMVKLGYTFATSAWNYASRTFPTNRGKTLAMVMKAAKVLENPRNSMAMKDMMHEVSGEVEISAQLNALASEAANKAANAADLNAASIKVRLYGTGNVLSSKGSGPSIALPMHRIATHEKVVEVADTMGIHRQDTAALDHALKSMGYTAIRQGTEKVRLIK